MTRASLLVGAVVMLCAMPVAAQLVSERNWDDSDSHLDPHIERTGDWYVSFSGGPSFLEDSEYDSLSDLGLSNDIEFDTGYNLNLAIGAYLNMFRVEGEISYRDAGIDSATIAGTDVPSSFFRGDVNALSLMGNGYIDIPINRVLDWYIGGGLGVAFVEGDIAGSSTIGGISYQLTTEDDDTVFAYQAMTGLAWQVAEPATVIVGYRLWSTEDPEFERREFDAPLVHTIEVGLRFDF